MGAVPSKHPPQITAVWGEFKSCHIEESVATLNLHWVVATLHWRNGSRSRSGFPSPVVRTLTLPGSPSCLKTTQIWSTGKLLSNDDSLMLPMNMTEGYLSCKLILKICFVKVWLLPQFLRLWIMFFDYLVLARKWCFDLNWLLDIVPSPSRFLIELSISMTSYFNNLLFCKRKMVERKYKVSYK